MRECISLVKASAWASVPDEVKRSIREDALVNEEHYNWTKRLFYTKDGRFNYWGKNVYDANFGATAKRFQQFVNKIDPTYASTWKIRWFNNKCVCCNAAPVDSLGNTHDFITHWFTKEHLGDYGRLSADLRSGKVEYGLRRAQGYPDV